MIQIDAERQFPTEEPWLDEGSEIILPLGADLDPQAEFLAAASESRRMKQIEITLADLDETNDGID